MVACSFLNVSERIHSKRNGSKAKEKKKEEKRKGEVKRKARWKNRERGGLCVNGPVNQSVSAVVLHRFTLLAWWKRSLKGL